MADVLTALDATFLELEQQNEGALMSIGGVMVFDPLPSGRVPSLEEVCNGIAARLTQLPRYSQRLSSPRTGGFAWPHWVDADRFDVRDHVTHVALPAPSGPGELCEWAGDFYSHPLDRTRPLWEMALVEGLERGRWALAHKSHECLVDGVGSVDVARVLLDPEPNPKSVAPAVLPRAKPPGLVRAARAAEPQPLFQAAGAGARAAGAAAHFMLHPRDALARSVSLTELLVRDALIAAPKTSLNVPISSRRRLAVVDVPLAELKAIRSALGGSLNDVILAACTTGLRRLLLERGEQPPAPGLRAMVPMNLRDASERLALGNRVSSLFVELPVAEPAPAARYRHVVASTARLKRSGAAAAAGAMLDLAALAPPILHATLVRSVYATHLFNVTITNVPGPQAPLYALGARLHEVWPVVPLAAEHAVGVAVFSYDGLVTFGVMADAASTPDIGLLAYGIEAGIDELLALAGATHDDFAPART